MQISNTYRITSIGSYLNAGWDSSFNTRKLTPRLYGGNSGCHYKAQLMLQNEKLHSNTRWLVTLTTITPIDRFPYLGLIFVLVNTAWRLARE